MSYLTEAQASEKRCCGPESCGEMRGVDRYSSNPLEMSTAMSRRYCIASACMAWRWGSSEFVPPEYPLTAVEERGRTSVVPSPSVEVKRGFCGLAGSVA